MYSPIFSALSLIIITLSSLIFSLSILMNKSFVSKTKNLVLGPISFNISVVKTPSPAPNSATASASFKLREPYITFPIALLLEEIAPTLLSFKNSLKYDIYENILI